MSSQAEAPIRKFYELMSRGLSADGVIADLEALLHPDVEYVNPPDAVEPGTRRGIAGWRTAVASTLEGLGSTPTFEIEEFVARGDLVFSRVSIRTGGTASGVEVAGPTIATVWTVREGLVRRFEWHWDPAVARAIFEDATS